MSRVGRRPITVPSGVEIRIEGRDVHVRGPRGELLQQIPQAITVAQEDGSLVVSRGSDQPEIRALHGLTRALLANMVIGVTDGFTRVLEISGVGYRATK